jgi:outer membrane murein-binding lipoprotein Lpp
MNEIDDGLKVKLPMRDLIMIMVFVGTTLVGYFGVIRDQEVRIVRLETQLENVSANISQMKQDVKEIKEDIKLMLKSKWQ